MEEKKDYRQQNIQKFYFNDEGKLVVESNKGVWVDGEQYVKMYGNFTCNARTMGIIIEKFKGNKVLVEKLRDDEYATEIVNPSDIEKQYNNELSYLQKKIEDYGDEICDLKKSIRKFNFLPWYKRMFKKIEIK